MGIGDSFRAGYNSVKKALPERKPMPIIQKKPARKPPMAAATTKKKEPTRVEPEKSKGESLASHGAKGKSLATKRN
jgi:hypothetical protein